MNEDNEKVEQELIVPEETGAVSAKAEPAAAGSTDGSLEEGAGEREESEELENLREELERVRGELTRLEHERFLLSRGVPEEDVDYYSFKIGKLAGAKDDFAKAAKEFLKAHPVKRASVSSGAELGSVGGRRPETSSELMNQLLRNR